MEEMGGRVTISGPFKGEICRRSERSFSVIEHKSREDWTWNFIFNSGLAVDRHELKQ